MDWKEKMQGMRAFKTIIQSSTEQIIAGIQRAVNKALVVAWLFVGTLSPLAVPVSLGTAAYMFVACSSDSPEQDITPPTITQNITTIDVTWWKEIRISGNQLFIWEEIVLSWKDNGTTNCKVELSLNGKTISSWTILDEEWTLSVRISKAGFEKNISIKLLAQDISWFENLKNISLQVDQEINLLKWVNFGNGAKLEKLEIEIDGQRIEISDPQHYTPSYPWTCNIILTIKDKDGNLVEYKTDTLTIKPLDYKAMEINNIKPVDILPIIGQVEVWDKECYNHIEHLRLAEATRIRDMMREYGAGNHSKEEYQQLMSRLNTGMTREIPEWYNNYELLKTYNKSPSGHAHWERGILNTLINHANFKVFVMLNEELFKTINNNDKEIYILWCSVFGELPYNDYCRPNDEEEQKRQNWLKLKNFIRFTAWSNIRDWHTKIYQEDVDNNDIYGVKAMPSSANWKNDKILDKHIMVTIGTNKDGNSDRTDWKYGVSKYPIWFHPKVLFSWRMFPYHDSGYKGILGRDAEYPTSDTNYLNVAMTDLCFQMFAEVKNADELLEMIRSTCLTDYIHLNWETQELQLINPAWFFQKYLMPTNIPNSIKPWENIQLEKWYYKWVVFDIPWAEVKVNGEWIAYNEKNTQLIKAQNPFFLEWRLNGKLIGGDLDLLRKMGYKPGEAIKGRILVVDDKWNGLNMTKEFSINLSP